MPRKLIFVTGNAGKIAEVQAFLGDTAELESQSVDIVEIQGTIEEVTRDKCQRAAKIVSFFGVYSFVDIRGSDRSWNFSFLLPLIPYP